MHKRIISQISSMGRERDSQNSITNANAVSRTKNMYESVADFYKNKSVLVTGGTGFLGKVILVKLLYYCPEIENIFILIRDHKGVSVEQQISKLSEHPLFSRIREENVNLLRKLIPVSGDVSLPNVGFSAHDEEMLLEKVSVVIHAAASVKFSEPLKEALKINVEGTRNILDLCQRMKKLEVLIHVSTAYTNTDKAVVEEVVYSPPAQLDDVYAYVKQEEEQTGDSKSILNGRPNTYTFTKALAESLIEKHHGNIPTVIVRPSIVTAVLDDPIPGWIGNWYGATGIVTASAKGLNRVAYGYPNVVLDLIPVDYVANFIIAAAVKFDRSKNLSVYNCCSSDCNPITVRDFCWEFALETVQSNAHVLPRPDLLLITKSHWLMALVTFIFQTVPAYIMDFWLLLQGKQTFFVKIQEQLMRSRESISPFTSQFWVMKTDKARALADSLSPADRSRFPFRPQGINWREYIYVYSAGVRRFLEKREDSQIS